MLMHSTVIPARVVPGTLSHCLARELDVDHIRAP